ncbi:MAG: oxygen-independent coproporphyrinogen III oxidase [Sphingomonas sp.]
MHRYIPELARCAVPRYTSYPTAAEFGDQVAAGAQARALDAVAPGEAVSLYVHVPYCRDICWYCGCNTGAVGREDRLAAYVQALRQEIDLVAPRLYGTVRSVHFGGGSPNALSPDAFATLARALRDGFAISDGAEWAAEIDPRHFTRAHADAFAAAGVRRISVGAQTFAPAIQAQIGRIQPYRVVAEAVSDARAAGIDRINLDLMYGLPDQTLDDIASTIAAARTLAPDRIAMFGYAHLPRALPRQRRIDATLLPGAEARFWQSALAHDLLVEAGFQAIGFDHFARPEDSLAVAARDGRLHRNFQGYTDDQAGVLVGLGASAISQFDGLIVQNEKHVGRYRMRVGNGLLPGLRGVRRHDDDRWRAQLIERLLCDGEVDAQRLAATFGVQPAALAPALEQVAVLATHGIATLDGGTVRITPEGRPYARLVAAAFDAYRKPDDQRFSRAV